MSSRLVNALGFFFMIVLLLTALRYKPVPVAVAVAVTGGEAIGSVSNPSPLEGFRGGQAINGRTAGPAATTLVPAPLMQEGFSDFQVKGTSEVGSDSGPGPASLLQPRKPYHLLSDTLKDAPRDTVGCLTAGCCNETDFEARTNLTGNYLQRTNNYKREYPDNCTGPLHDFTMAFYKTTRLQSE